MTKQILTQLESKTISVKLKDDGTFSGIEQIELQDFTIEYFLEVQAYFSAPEPTTLEHYYPGGDLEGADIEINDIVIFDSNGDEIELPKEDIDSIFKMIENNLEF